jgi:predicted transcriptional regulator
LALTAARALGGPAWLETRRRQDGVFGPYTTGQVSCSEIADGRGPQTVTIEKVSQMPDEIAAPATELLELTADIVSAYVSNNPLPVSELARVIADTYASISKLQAAPEPQPEEKRAPAVPIKKSLTPDFIICLEDGKQFKSLKRHIGTHYNLTPNEYRAKWGLPVDYPMVAPNYAAARSQLAKASGLGRKAAVPAPAAQPVPAPAKRRKIGLKIT